MLVVLDTNILFQGLDSDKGASFFILKLLEARKINIALSYPVVREYEDVLKTKENLKRLGLTLEDVGTFLAYSTTTGIPFDPTFLLRPNLKDEKDNIFAELAFVSNTDSLITNNVRDFTQETDLILDNFKPVIPKEFVIHWRKIYEK
jgi:putative PIN family toxin of toxin-antitoxin system